MDKKKVYFVVIQHNLNICPMDEEGSTEKRPVYFLAAAPGCHYNGFLKKYHFAIAPISNYE